MPNTRELMVKHWLAHGRPMIDTRFLKALERQFAKRLRREALSPAAVARLLADEGAELRHPDVIEFDAQWREEQLRTHAGELGELAPFVSGNALNLEKARVFITKLEALRRQFENEGDDSSLSQLQRLGVEARQRAEVMAKNRKLAAEVRGEQSELAEWLKVWLQTPSLFGDWLELRSRSDEFRKKFPGDTP